VEIGVITLRPHLLLCQFDWELIVLWILERLIILQARQIRADFNRLDNNQ
jgi:hypothetical protein